MDYSLECEHNKVQEDNEEKSADAVGAFTTGDYYFKT